MGKRLHDTDIWEQDWFIDLPTKYKMCFFFIKDKCDSAGIWRPNKSLIQKIIGEPINLDEFLTFVNVEKSRIKVLPTGRWFLQDFFIFQYGDKFSPTSPVHKGALKQLLSNGVHIGDLLKLDSGNLKQLDFQQLREIGYQKGSNSLSIAYGKDSNRTKDIDKDKEYIEIEGEGMGEEERDLMVEQKILQMIVPEMMKIWKTKKPDYFENKDYDYPALLTIAYLICKEKQWKKADAIGVKEKELLIEWGKLAKFISCHKFFKEFSLDSASSDKNWQKIINAIREQRTAVPSNGNGMVM